jgi:hypothetical protein
MTEERSTGMTFGDLQRVVCDAIRDTLTGQSEYGYSYAYVVDMTPDMVIYTTGGETFECSYSIDAGNTVTLGDPVPVVQVTTYSPVAEANAATRPGTERRLAFGPDQIPNVQVTREPLTYERHLTTTSYFKDRIDLEMHGDNAARSRLERHGKEMDVELARRDAEARSILAGAKIETRADPSRTPGMGGYFAPPLWLVEKFAPAKRPARLIANLIDAEGGLFPLPSGVQSVNIPLLTTGNAEVPEADDEDDDSQNITDIAKSSPVVTISGDSDAALQLLEQSGAGAAFDWAMFKDLAESYDADLDSQILYGTGSGGQFTGITTVVTTANAIAYTDASPTLSEMYPSLGKAAAAVGDNRNLPPQAWLMRTARWAWIGTSLDSSSRPIVPPALGPPPRPAEDEPQATSSILGWPVYCDDSISVTLGATGTQDQIVVFRPADLLLLEGTPHTAVMMEPLSGSLQVRIQLRNYAALVIGHVSSIAIVTGTGMVVQSGW